VFDTTRGLRELGFDHVALRQGPRTVGEILIPERLFFAGEGDSCNRHDPTAGAGRNSASVASLRHGRRGNADQTRSICARLNAPAFGLDPAVCLAPRRRGATSDIHTDRARSRTPVRMLQGPEPRPSREITAHFEPDMVGSCPLALTK